MSRRLQLVTVAAVLTALLVAGYLLLLRPESLTLTVTDTYNTDSSGAHPLPEQEQRPETLTTRWVVAKSGLTYQAREGKFELGKTYTCTVHHPSSGLELRGCKAA
ncbi:hypothetical protein OJ997_24100 [Solirubrobacter phytolaccae]|uniref:Uncharacterized protein n=1 Tax=Solirubrobacter phytolaccae TaxID=1404360 RepID=A0A9X3NB84_9ACTN|nr:hypothetical protein [Solirubrobacter phytolaccae]MDA0183415.1 hypothetical protein [Solirubrobacter phytolaccae]